MRKNERFIIQKNGPLSGTVKISGSKNAALPILAATLLAKGNTTLYNVPELTDITVMCEILNCLGAEISNPGKNIVTVDATCLHHTIAPYELTGRMRGSFLVMGPLLARMKKVRLSLPGGCPIGSRPVDLHLKGFSLLGAEVEKGYGFAEVSANKLIGNRIYLDFPSVGATENVLMAAVLAEGTTVIENAAAEPEISDLAAFLNQMGARVSGAGTDTITIRGVSELKPTTYTIMPDRIEAGSFMIAAAITNGHIKIQGAEKMHLKPLTAKLEEMGVEMFFGTDFLSVKGKGLYNSTDVKTLPFPGFPTDMQAQMMALLSLSNGTGIVTETVFENRFMHAQELCRMGANIKVEGHCAVVEGTKALTGTKVSASDLRAGAALTLAGLVAEGTTEIFGVHHIDRGYEAFDKKLCSLGAKVERIFI